jgi:hypothetical protein
LDKFVDFLNVKSNNFMDYNKDSLYILRGGNFLDIKNLFAAIGDDCVNIGRGGSQKAHMLSPEVLANIRKNKSDLATTFSPLRKINPLLAVGHPTTVVNTCNNSVKVYDSMRASARDLVQR